MANLSKKAVETISKLNEQLLEAEYKLEAQQRAVSKYRYYLAADANSSTVMDLRGAMANLRAYQKRVNELREQLERALDQVFAISLQSEADLTDDEGKTDEELDREFEEQHPRLKEGQALMEKAANAKQMSIAELTRSIAQELSAGGTYRIGHPWHEVKWAEVKHEEGCLYRVTLNEDDEMFGDTHTELSHIGGIILDEAAMAISLFVRSN